MNQHHHVLKAYLADFDSKILEYANPRHIANDLYPIFHQHCVSLHSITLILNKKRSFCPLLNLKFSVSQLLSRDSHLIQAHLVIYSYDLHDNWLHSDGADVCNQFEFELKNLLEVLLVERPVFERFLFMTYLAVIT